jgi:sterol desaturase/sphingolipid hydroxylase (fatty acid hydroxylase superfamily)
LHGLGRKKKSFFSSHWNTHHNKARKNEYFDEDYLSVFSGWNEGLKEIMAIFLLSLLQIPTILIFPYYSVTMIFMGILYFAIHRKSHLNPSWAKKYVPWHYDHHMGKNQDANWCVTFPLWDYILGTRQKSNVVKTALN